MANKKSNPKKSDQKETIINKIADQVGHLAGEFVARKEHFVEMAGDAIGSVKSTIQNITAKKKPAPEKTLEAAVKKVAVKSSGNAAKKVAKKATAAAPEKTTARSSAPAVKKVAKPAAKKVAVKKAAPLKKVASKK